MREILKSNGKFFPSSPTLLPPASLPAWNSKAITGRSVSLPEDLCGQVTLLTLCFSAYSEPQLESFRRPFMEAGGKMMEVRPLMGRMKWWMFSRILRSVAMNSLPIEGRDSFVVAYRPMALLDALDVPNYLGAYVYLIDKQGRVRWKASGQATEDELVTMNRLKKQLLSESE
jgi:hypothetical protein